MADADIELRQKRRVVDPRPVRLKIEWTRLGAKGWRAAPGASYLPTDNWPRFEVTGPYPKLGGGQGGSKAS